MDNPKTYMVRIAHLFQNYTNSNPYLFYIHTDSYESACDYVESIFEGINTKEARLKLVEGNKTNKIGNSDQVSIIDCDSYPDYVWKNGKRVSVQAPLGKNRKTEFEVHSGLMYIFNNLKCDYDSFIGNVSYYKSIGDIDKSNLAAIRAKTILYWMSNVFSEWLCYQKIKLGNQ